MKNQCSISLRANRAAKDYGTNRATRINLLGGETMQLRASRSHQTSGDVSTLVGSARVTHYDGYHAESRTGIRASMAALKRFWSTYHYVATVCLVAVPDIDAIYSCDSH